MKKNTFKLIFAFAFAFAFALSNFSNASANTLVKDPCTYDYSNYNLQESNSYSINGNPTYDILDFEKAAVDNNIPLEKEGKELVGISVIFPNNEVIEEDKSLPNFQTFAASEKVTVTTTSEGCGLEVIRSSWYPAGKATVTIKDQVTAKYTTSVSFDFSLIKAAVGFDMTNKYNVSDEWSGTVPKGEQWNIIASPTFLIKQFDMFRDGKNVGSGTAYKPIGVCFTVVKYKA